MGKIHIKRNGEERIFDLAYIKYDDMVALNIGAEGTTDINELAVGLRWNALIEGTLQNLPADGVDDKFYIFKFSPNNGAELAGSTIVGYEPDIGTSSKGGRPLYFGAFQKTGDEISSFFDKTAEFFNDIPPAGVLDPNDVNSIKYNYLNLGADYYPGAVLVADNNVDVRANYRVNYNSVALFETSVGGQFGASLGVCGGGIGLTQNIAIHSFGLNSEYKDGTHYGTGDFNLAGNQYGGFHGKPFGPKFNNLQILPYPSNERDWNAHMSSAGSWSSIDDGSPKQITDDIDSFFICTSVNGLLYVGMAACRFSGRYVTDIQVTFLPAWFWGRGSLELDFDMDDVPDFNDTWYGPDVPRKTGGNGSWTITQSGSITTSAPVETAFSWMGPASNGVHLLMCNGRALQYLLGMLWGYSEGDRTKAFASIIAAHQIPAQLLPDVNSANFARWVGLADDSLFFGQRSGEWINGWMQWIDPDMRFDAGAVKPYLASFTSENNGPLSAYTDSYLDFNPHTQVQLFLPFAGNVTIPPEQCIGGRIDVAAHIYYPTGDICYYVKCTSNKEILADDNGLPITNVYPLMGNCAVDIPLIGITTGERQKMSNALNAIGGGFQIAAGMATGNPFMVAGGISGIANSATSVGQVGGSSLQAGGIGGNTALIGSKQIVLRITKPQKAYEPNWLLQNGVISEKQIQINTIKGSGFLKVRNVDVNTVSTANSGEKEEIRAKLMGGVFV